MINSKAFFALVLLTGILASCLPQAATAETTSTQPAPTQTAIPPTVTFTFTPVPTETALASDTPSPTAPPCAVPINPIDHATVPAQGPFDFTWTPFEGAVSYIISIGPANWFPTNFPVNGTTLTRYMESFPTSPAYEWSIAAIGGTGQEICRSGPYTFVTSTDLHATPSFVINDVPVAESENSSSSSSSNSSDTSQTGSEDSSPPSNNSSFSDTSFMIQGDSDTQDCRLGVTYRVKSNQEFVFIRLIYQSMDGSVNGSADFTAASRDPYPAYNSYTAVTEPLPVKYGDTIRFGVWFRLAGGGESRGLTLQHSMTNCNQ